MPLGLHFDQEVIRQTASSVSEECGGLFQQVRISTGLAFPSVMGVPDITS